MSKHKRGWRCPFFCSQCKNWCTAMTSSMGTPYLELVGEAKLAERVQNDNSDEIRAPLERVLCTLIVPSLFGTSYYPLSMYSPEDDFKKPSLRPHFCPRKQGASGPVKGFRGSYKFIFLFTALSNRRNLRM